jgi:hypothetical protein
MTGQKGDKRTIDRLILVFNADSGALSAWFDSARKLLRIRGCSLCATTHGLVGETPEWRRAKARLGVPVDHVHRDEIGPRLREVVGEGLPAIVAELGGERLLLLGPDVLDRSKGDVAALEGRLHEHASLKGLAFPGRVS